MIVKTVDIVAKEWWDKVNGNHYFSAQVTLNYSLPDELTLYIPFQYGYGDQYEAEAVKELKPYLDFRYDDPFTWRLREHGIIVRSCKHEKCLKRDVVLWGAKK